MNMNSMLMKVWRRTKTPIWKLQFTFKNEQQELVCDGWKDEAIPSGKVI